MERKFIRGFQNPIGRWAAIGPYYAMFPLEFAFEVVQKYSESGQLVIDPFAGRASSIYAAATQGRFGLGIEINPLGWIYAQAKLNPAPLASVETRLHDITRFANKYHEQATALPRFFRSCYSTNVRAFLLAARSNPNWKRNQVDRTLMAFILVYLHGKLGEGLSNQMRMTKAMGPVYSVRWWKEHNFKPPEVDCNAFFLSRIRWRYATGVPDITSSVVRLGDSTLILQNEANKAKEKTGRRCSLLFTSPPYCGITDYHKDQWLRLWLLGGTEQPLWSSEIHKGRFDSKVAYRSLLDNVFGQATQFMDKHATIYVRTDSREFTFTTTLEVLRGHFPKWKEKIKSAPVSSRTQTDICGNKSSRPGEIDIILSK